MFFMTACGRVLAADFELGVAAFKSQNYVQAIDYFEQARKQGADTPVLHYNLAVSYFKQQQYDQARESFQLALQQNSLAAISHYNIGLVALKENTPKIAEQAFKQSFNLADDERLKLLAARQLERLLPPEQQKSLQPKRLSGFLSIGLVRDSNVRHANEELPTVSAEADRYLDLFGVVNYQMIGTRRQGLQLKLGFVSNRYKKLPAYNQQTVNLGFYFSSPLAGWESRVGLHVYRDKLDGKPYQQRLVAQLRGDNYYAKGQRLRLRYDLSQYKEKDTVYAYLSGLKHRLQAENRSRFGTEELRFSYKFELNKREDLTLGNSFVSVSPVRQTVSAKWRHSFNLSLISELALDYRTSDYRDNNVINGVAQMIRKEQRSRIAIAGIYRLNRQADLEVRWRYTRNDANIVSEEYSNHQLMMSGNLYF